MILAATPAQYIILIEYGSGDMLHPLPYITWGLSKGYSEKKKEYSGLRDPSTRKSKSKRFQN